MCVRVWCLGGPWGAERVTYLFRVTKMWQTMCSGPFKEECSPIFIWLFTGEMLPNFCVCQSKGERCQIYCFTVQRGSAAQFLASVAQGGNAAQFFIWQFTGEMLPKFLKCWFCYCSCRYGTMHIWEVWNYCVIASLIPVWRIASGIVVVDGLGEKTLANNCFVWPSEREMLHNVFWTIQGGTQPNFYLTVYGGNAAQLLCLPI